MCPELIGILFGAGTAIRLVSVPLAAASPTARMPFV